MKTILFIVGPALGHVGRSLVIARALLESSARTRIVFAHIVSGHDDLLLEPEFQCIRVGYKTRGDECFAEELELAMKTIDPALICLDLSPVPWLYFVKFPAKPKAYITNFFLTSLLDEETYQVRHLRANFSEMNRRRSKRDLPELHDVKSLYDADVVLLCDPAELIESSVTLADGPHRVVGPCVWQPAGALPAQLRKPGRVLLVSLGSTGSRPLPGALVEKLRRALECDSSVWVTGSPIRESEHLGLVCSGVPLSPILRKSALAITQGGAGSTYSSLLEGVPVAVWPNHRNHEILGELLLSAGVGAFVSELGNLGFGEIRSRVACMENQSRRFRTASGLSAGPRRAAEILLSMV